MDTVKMNSALQTLQVSHYTPTFQMTVAHFSKFKPRRLGGKVIVYRF